MVLRVSNRGKASAPATTVLVTTSSDSVNPKPMEYPIKALEPDESVTFSYVLAKPCTTQQVTAVIRKPVQATRSTKTG